MPRTAVIPFQTPSNIIVVASTGCGKTFLVYQLLQNASVMFETAPKSVIYCFNVYQKPLFDQMKTEIENIEFFEGLPSRENLHEWNRINSGHKIIVLDDLLQKVSASNDVVDLFCVLSSHMNYTVFFLVQNVFGDSKKLRTISLNAHYFVIFKNQRHQGQVQTLGSQIFPGQTSFFMDAYKKAVSRPYGYLLIDIHPRGGNPSYVLRTNILPHETTIVYKPIK